MVDVSQYTGLITSEHADKPKFTAMVSAVAQCFVDQQNALGNFIPSFDLDEAVGAQLDTLGAWVGIGRRVRTPLTGVYFSFDIAGVGFDQGVWQGPFDPSTGITVLDDDTYRLLIRAKIGANHWDGTMASSAAILNLIFQGGTTPRHLTATNELFATGDGSTGAFQLTVGGIPVYSNINVASIYRNDWQGNQLLYATARTNLALQSLALSSATWGAFSGSIAVSAIKPDGTNPLYTYTQATAGAIWRQTTLAIVAGNTYTVSYIAAAGSSPFFGPAVGDGTNNFAGGIFQLTGSGAVLRSIAGAQASAASAAIVALPTPGLYLCSLTFTANTSATGRHGFGVSDGSTFANAIFPSATSGTVSAGYAQAETGAVATSRINTTTAAVTVTDYTVGSTGIVAMGQKPVSGAKLTWNGTGDAYPGGTQVFIEDHQDMSISFGVAGKLPSALFLALLSGGYVPIKPEGVHVRDYITTSVDGAPIFGFDMMGPYVAGFDVGTWGTPLH